MQYKLVRIGLHKKDSLNNSYSIVKRYNLLKENLYISQELSKTGSWTHNLISNEVYLSEEVYEILGRDNKGFDGNLENYYLCIYPDDLEKVKRATQGALSGNEYDIEYRITTADGTIKYVHEKTKALCDENGKPVKMVGIIQDITEHKILEKSLKALGNKIIQPIRATEVGLTKNKMLQLKLKNSYRIINQTQDLAHMGSWEMDLIKNRIFFSDEAYRIYGIIPEQYDGTYDGFLKKVHPEDVSIIENMIGNPGNKPIEVEFRFIRSDGSIRNIYQLVEFIFDDNGKPIYIYGTIQDITEKKELQRALEREQERTSSIQRRFNALVKESSVVYEILDPDGTLVYISESSEKVIGYKPEERLGKKIYDYYNEEEKQKLSSMVGLVLSEPNQKVQMDIIFKSKGGKDLYLDVYMENFLHDPAIGGIVVNFRDITSRVKMEKSIRHLSLHDDLTGLPNYRLLKKKLRALCKNGNRDKKSFAVFMLDIDSYKSISDTLGYQLGERLIIEIARRLKLYCGRTKSLYRYSGDRFVIIVENESNTKQNEKREEHKKAYEVFAREIIGLFSQAIRVGSHILDVNVSLGITIYHNDSQNNEMLIRQAETALFLAKKEGPNKFKFHSSEPNIQDYKLFTLRNDLRKALEENQFRICYQPIVKLTSNRILAAEALIRWEHPEWGMVSPGEFIPQAEETGLIINMGDWILREVCRNYRQWLDKGLPKIHVAVNYSSIQFFDDNLVERIINTINDFGLNPEFLIVEITESVLMTEAEKAASIIKRLQYHGIQVALDDFGTGFSSLAYLSSFKIDILKIDGSFIKSAIKNENSNIITKSIINMARELNIKLVAEGIEKWEQLSYLLKLKCKIGQGYLYSKPLFSDEFEKVLAKGVCKP